MTNQEDSEFERLLDLAERAGEALSKKTAELPKRQIGESPASVQDIHQHFPIELWVIFTDQRDAFEYPRLFKKREDAEAILRKMGLEPIPPPHFSAGYAWSFDGQLSSDPVWFLDQRVVE
jgi:hypothetical protein